MICKCLIFLVLILAAVIVYLCIQYFVFGDEYFNVDIYSKEILFETDEKFLSVALDVSFMRCLFHKFTDADWKKLEELSTFLAPAYLRFGGNDADRTIFTLNNTENEFFVNDVPCEDFAPKSALYITAKNWMKLNKFAQNSGLSLVMDLNVLLRNNSRWDSKNAELLIKFSEENDLPLDFQLGNEPNSFFHVFDTVVTGKELAQDFRELKRLLKSTKKYQNSKVIGPDVTKPEVVEKSALEFLAEFLSEGGEVVDAISWHQYYLNGRTATLNDFINLETLDVLQPEVESVLKIVRQYSSNKSIWISETGSAFGGGAPKLSNRFAASFLWVDKLGMAAKLGMKVIARQSLFKGYYALIGHDFTPFPDFWISVLYKLLVGTRVISVKVAEKENSKFLRLYGHCLAPSSQVNGTIVIYGVNLYNETMVFFPSGTTFSHLAYSFIFRPRFNSLKSQTVLLNGHILTYNGTGVPDLISLAEEVTSPLVFPSHSIGFWVLKETGDSECQSSN